MKFAAAVLIFFLSIISTCFPSQTDANKDVVTEQNSKMEISDDKQKIVFYRANLNGSAGELFIMDEDGKNQTQIGKSGSRPDHYPNWSPDGKLITFESYRRGGWRTWIMNVDGTDARRVLPNGSGTNSYEFDPSFTSNGEDIVFISKDDIFTVGIDGKNITQITETPDTFEFSPHQSPDGKKIVFCVREKDNFNIYTIDSDGSNRTNISNHSSKNYAPIWSPDGKEIAFYSDRNGSFELFLMDSDGKNQKPLLNKEQLGKAKLEKAKFVHAFDNDWGAMTQYKSSFSCDGAKIAFSRDIDGNREIFTVNKDGSNLKRLTNNKMHDGFPMWKPCKK